jgi:Ohr subfamily peroxiredoxin
MLTHNRVQDTLSRLPQEVQLQGVQVKKTIPALLLGVHPVFAGWVSQRRVESSDGIVKFNLSVPREMGGPGKPGTSNPEQLFASGYSACFAGAIGFVANQQHKKLSDIQVTGHVTFGKVDENSTYNAGGTTYPLPGFQLAVQLDVHLPGVDKAEAEKLVEQAHQVCPYSRATRNNIEVKLAVV